MLSTQTVPAWTENAAIVGKKSVHTLDDLKAHRMQEVAFLIASLVLTNYFRADDPNGGNAGLQVWLFPQILAIVNRWLDQCVSCKDDVFPQRLLMIELAHSAAEKVHRAIAAATPGEARIRAVLQPNDATGSTASVSFDSTRGRWQTAPDKCHINYAVLDSDWERHLAQSFEQMPEVRSYVKNHNLYFKIPYSHEGKHRHYYPDYLVRVDDGRGPDDLLTLVVEVSGQDREDKQAKVDTARTMWVPAVNAERTFGRWAFVEIRDPLCAQSALREFLSNPCETPSTRRDLSVTK